VGPILNFVFKSSIESSLAPIAVDASLYQQKSKQAASNYGLPLRLKIPTINVDAALEQVGITPEGALGIPKNLTSAGWFSLGPRPGENGNAVIDGHYSQKASLPAVFDNLHQLIRGDKLYVQDEKGTSITFVVRQSRSYDPKADTSDVFRSTDGAAHLNLITCEGAWDEATKSYSKRLVIFADRE
jgi:LPXTG-site transpeptidase (sortase) family protein